MRKTVQVRDAVRRMAPYHPPTAGRGDKLRLDFNENTLGCSPRIIERLREQGSAAKIDEIAAFRVKRSGVLDARIRLNNLNSWVVAADRGDTSMQKAQLRIFDAVK